MNEKLVNRYSEALLDASLQEKNTDVVYDEATSLINLISSSKELKLLLYSPVIQDKKKIDIINKLFKKKLNILLYNLLVILIKNGREIYAIDILKRFIDSVDERNNILKPEYTSAIELNDKEKSKIIKELNALTGKKNRPDFKENKNLIGGFMIKYDDVVYDASIRRQLDNMKKMLKSKN